MDDLQWIRRPSDDSPARSVAGFLGSFDPPHKGHAWVARHLLAGHDRVVLVLPSHHLHKQIQPPHNATLEQRARMLAQLRDTCPERIGIALCSEVLYLRLAECLHREFPAAEIGFGMGDESCSKLQASAAWFARAGLPWGPQQERSLAALLPRVVVFGRARTGEGAIELPASLRTVSSTRVRRQVGVLRSNAVPWERWTSELAALVEAPIARFVWEEGLYPWLPAVSVAQGQLPAANGGLT